MDFIHIETRYHASPDMLAHLYSYNGVRDRVFKSTT